MPQTTFDKRSRKKRWEWNSTTDLQRGTYCTETTAELCYFPNNCSPKDKGMRWDSSGAVKLARLMKLWAGKAFWLAIFDEVHRQGVGEAPTP
ncbi:hypothetical protein Nepgr_016859 [Nepenthes gracilis]|uniref:Uncharacterized protein n=1 Tax=Nepenthes gracilis TaxID=150966 RepID=A0AAD3SNE1_NEPGR|nr:hypothetical protein Nepgr_016859 [Nepenthes gracilis]